MVGLDRVTVTVLDMMPGRPEYYLPPHGEQQVSSVFLFPTIHPSDGKPAGHLHTYALASSPPAR
jgi:hypothetical protein